jgi:hypothetical protein
MAGRTIAEILKEFFDNNPNREITQSEAVDHVFKFVPKARDPWRAVRILHEEGYLIQVRKGVYMRIPGYKGDSGDDPFPPEVKEAIFKRDNYRCAVCGNGRHNGYEIHADHIQPRSKGGKSTLENGQTLCSEHNMLKKNYGTTDFLNKYCEKMLARAKQLGDRKTEAMFEGLLKVIKKNMG